jgi:hypothetical protein
MIRNRGLSQWLPVYLRETVERHRLRHWRGVNLTHVVLLVCDHFEPQHGVGEDVDRPARRIRHWHEQYKQLQDEWQGKYGLKPQHTWFYPPHHGYGHLPALANMVFDGLGEVEFHYHHEGDTEASLRAALSHALEKFRESGLLLQQGSPPAKGFCFIHGDWALDNSAGGRYCGVDSEISLLQELGCWADLTMPSANECQTRKINSIYYAVDDKVKPKSHDWGINATAGRADNPGLLMLQGPLAVNWRAPRYPRIENASLTTDNWGRLDRIRTWVDCHVHVQGRQDWLFIKLHCHGALEKDFDSLFGARARTMHTQLCEHFNDGKRYRMHYVSARQAVNLVHAAEDGNAGDPDDFLDYRIPRPAASQYWASMPHVLESCTARNIELGYLRPELTSRTQFRLQGTLEVSGLLRRAALRPEERMLELQTHAEGGRVTLEVRGGPRFTTYEGADVLEELPECTRLSCTGSVKLRF